jgi:hypothetical protein
MGVSGQRYAPTALSPGYYWIGGWMGPRAGPDTEARGKILCLCRGSNCGHLVCSQTLYRSSLIVRVPHARFGTRWNCIISFMLRPLLSCLVIGTLWPLCVTMVKTTSHQLCRSVWCQKGRNDFSGNRAPITMIGNLSAFCSCVCNIAACCSSL